MDRCDSLRAATELSADTSELRTQLWGHIGAPDTALGTRRVRSTSPGSAVSCDPSAVTQPFPWPSPARSQTTAARCGSAREGAGRCTLTQCAGGGLPIFPGSRRDSISSRMCRSFILPLMGGIRRPIFTITGRLARWAARLCAVSSPLSSDRRRLRERRAPSLSLPTSLSVAWVLRGPAPSRLSCLLGPQQIMRTPLVINDTGMHVLGWE